VTTCVRLTGDGHQGCGEDVSPYQGEADALHHVGSRLPRAGRWTLESYRRQLASIDQWPVPARWESVRRWRSWGLQAAGLDLALRQNGIRLDELAGRAAQPVHFVHSLALGTPPAVEQVIRRLDRHPGLRLKLDVTPACSAELLAEVAATRAVDILDCKGWYPSPEPDDRALVSFYERVLEAFPEVILEDPHPLPMVSDLLRTVPAVIAYDAPISTAQDLERTPLPPAAINVKPCRAGDLPVLLDLCAAAEARGLLLYGGGMDELGVGRRQIQHLAALFYPAGPNDVAPAGYNIDPLGAGLPESPLPPPASVGFGPAE